jgi:hypothetical protein
MAQPENAATAADKAINVGAMMRQAIYNITENSVALLPQLLVGIVVFILFWIAAKILRRLSERLTEPPYENQGDIPPDLEKMKELAERYEIEFILHSFPRATQ